MCGPVDHEVPRTLLNVATESKETCAKLTQYIILRGEQSPWMGIVNVKR